MGPIDSAEIWIDQVNRSLSHTLAVDRILAFNPDRQRDTDCRQPKTGGMMEWEVAWLWNPINHGFAVQYKRIHGDSNCSSRNFYLSEIETNATVLLDALIGNRNAYRIRE